MHIKIHSVVVLFMTFFLPVISLRAKTLEYPDPEVALKSATFSYKMVDLKTGETVAAHNPDLCSTPASITKLITTATALEILGGDFTFDTRIETDGFIEDGTLYGNLIIRGGADPTLGSVYLGDRNFIAYFASVICRKNIRRITGDVIACADCLDRCPVSIKWNWEDLGFHYGAGSFGLTAYDNTSIILLNSSVPGTRPEIISVWPDAPDMLNINEIETLSIPNDSVYVFSAPYGRQRILQGGMPADRNNYVVKASITNPPLLVASYLYRELTGRGVAIDGKAMAPRQCAADDNTVIYTYHSPSLAKIIRITNVKSNNLYAEQTFRRLGNIIMSRNATIAASIQVIKSYWAAKGIDVGSLFLYDGCGLAPQNAFSANMLTSILVEMRNSDEWHNFYNSLPVAGKEGTVCNLFYRTPLEGKARIKSGSISNVQCYSGYITPSSGNQYAFTIMVNNYNCTRKEVRKIIEQILLRDAK